MVIIKSALFERRSAIRQPMLIKKKKTKGQIAAYVFLLPALIVFALFKYYPILQGIFISFFEIDIVNLPGRFSGIDNYLRAFSDAKFYAALGNNIKFLIYGMLMQFWPPIILAMLINEVVRGKTAIRLFYFIPAVAPGIAIAILFKYIWKPDYGLANYLLSMLNIPPQMWLNDPKLVYFCMAFPGMILSGGMNMVIYLAAMQDVPREHYEAAMIEGAGFFRRFFSITLPEIRNIIGIMFVLDVIGRFNEITTPLVMTGGGPVGSTETLILYAYKQATHHLDYSYAITMANIVFIIVFIITAFQMKLTGKDD